MAQTGRFTIKSLCEDFGISRKTGYKYLSRYQTEGRAGLKERSRRPKCSPNATVESVEKLILKERRKHETWGPKKIRNRLMRVHGIEHPPHESTIADLVLSRHGLSQKRKRRAGVFRVHPDHLTEATRPNEVWTFDFKGWFLLQDGQRCDPLTVCDRFSRYVIGCHAPVRRNQQFKGTLRASKNLMRGPWSARGHPGGQWYAVCLYRTGRLVATECVVDRTGHCAWSLSTPGCPQQNGSHERMHRDLKAEATKPPSRNLSAQQKRFERWRHEYNHDRPHESLDMLRPAEVLPQEFQAHLAKMTKCSIRMIMK